MATSCNIAIVEENGGQINYVYCHFDGYLEGVGKTLTDFYKTREQVEALIAMGDISGLDENIEKSVFYHRDRGEDLVQSWVFSEDDLREHYNYLFKNDKWYYKVGNSKTWNLLNND